MLQGQLYFRHLHRLGHDMNVFRRADIREELHHRAAEQLREEAAEPVHEDANELEVVPGHEPG